MIELTIHYNEGIANEKKIKLPKSYQIWRCKPWDSHSTDDVLASLFCRSMN